MSRLARLPTLAALLCAACASAAADDVKTGIRGVVTVTYLPGVQGKKVPDPVPLKDAVVRVYPDGVADKPAAETKTDDKGTFVVALEAGKYRVEVAAPSGVIQAPPSKVDVKDGSTAEMTVNVVVPRR